MDESMDNKKLDGWTDGRTDGWNATRMENICMDGQKDGWTDEQTDDGWTDRQTNE